MIPLVLMIVGSFFMSSDSVLMTVDEGNVLDLFINDNLIEVKHQFIHENSGRVFGYYDGTPYYLIYDENSVKVKIWSEPKTVIKESVLFEGLF